MSESEPHQSVLPLEIIESFAGFNCRYFVDATLGAGGHALALLAAHPEIELYIGIDQDPDAIAIATKRLAPWQHKLLILQGNFADVAELLAQHQITSIDAMLMDLGVSSMQLDRREKGFSFMQEGPLDMRMSPENPISAEEIVNNWPEADLGRIFRSYGEEKQWRQAARVLVQARAQAPITTTKQLTDILLPLLGWKYATGKHPLTLIFQALRIAVNDELVALERVLPQAIDLLQPHGRLAVISFHSLEDRIVKNCFRQAASDKLETSGLSGLFIDKKPTVALLTKRPIAPSDVEIAHNPRSRSAKLRVLEKL